MLSRVFSQYTDAVHVIPSKCFKGNNLFDIAKYVIIALEDIGFRVISLIADNNAINK